MVGCSDGNGDGQSSGDERLASETDQALTSGECLLMIHEPGGWLRNDSLQAVAWIPFNGWVTYHSGSLTGGVVVNWKGTVGHAWGPYFAPCSSVIISK
jgi:hypothetical protein